MNFLGGLVGIIVGFLLIKYSLSISDMFGSISWAEAHLGGTSAMYRLVGVVIIVLSFLYMFGAIGIILGPLAGVFGGGQ
jgi:hypothetical protein